MNKRSSLITLVFSTLAFVALFIGIRFIFYNKKNSNEINLKSSRENITANINITTTSVKEKYDGS